MEAADLMECLRLLDGADRLLAGAGELVLVAHLAAVVEPLRRQAEAAGLGPQLDGLGRPAVIKPDAHA